MLARKEVKLRATIVCVGVCACSPSEGIGVANHPSGGTMTGPICRPKQTDWSEKLWLTLAQTQLTTTHQLPLITLFCS